MRAKHAHAANDMTFKSLLLAYVAGGLTFIPLLALLLGAFAYVAFTKPVTPVSTATTASDVDAAYTAKTIDEIGEKSKEQQNELDTAAAYFAVCREYVPGGINGKPPERSTPAGEVLIAESPSVYQSMYRSIFERGKTQIPTIEGDKRDGKAVKKARNVFYVVLRHGHLMLYDDSEQVEVRHVVSLAHHDIDVYAGGDPVPEGDLWIKRNCIRLTRKPLSGDTSPTSKPFHFFSDNCSEKEDFYHALLHTQSSIINTDPPPLPQKFETADIIKLVQNLHSSDADAHSRWINGIVGRIFLAMYKTKDIENFIRAKINKKISRVPKPNLIASINIMDIDMGDSAPIISNPRLKELTVNGDMTIELDIKYNGGFKIEMGAVARIDLGARFKAREVSLIMAGELKKLSGHLLIRIKPPPSNRIWMTFEAMPQIEMSIQPIVSSRQITYGVILRAIESRIREVIGETIVLPNWDDSPFLDTTKKEWRGGIFEPSSADEEPTSMEKAAEADVGLVETAAHELTNSAGDGDSEDIVIPTLAETGAKTLSMPSLLEPVQKLNFRKNARRSATSLVGEGLETPIGASTSTTSASTPVQTPSSPPLRPRTPPGKPRNMRSNSFAAVATPLVSTEGSNIEAVRSQTKKKGQKDAVEMVKEVNSKAQSAATSPKPLREIENILSIDSETFSTLATQEEPPLDPSVLRRSSEPVEQHSTKQRVQPQEPIVADVLASAPKAPSVKSLETSAASGSSPSHLSTAANAAKKWGWQVLNRQNGSSPSTSGNSFGLSKRFSVSSASSGASSVSLPSQPPDPNALKAALLAQPMGRGMPLPPPGTPLPGPQRSLWASSGLNLPGLKRKPVGASSSSQQQQAKEADKPEHVAEPQPRQPPPLPARPRPVSKNNHQKRSSPIRTEQHMTGDPDVFVVAAPVEEDSMPNTPIVERVADHGIPAYAEEAPVASDMQAATTEPPTESPLSHEQPIPEQAVTSQVTAEQLMPEQTATEHQVEPHHPIVQEIGLTQHARPVAEQAALEPTKTEPTRTNSYDTRHDSEDGEIGDSLDAADVAGEMRGSL
ncbi:hypothetical protein D6D01_06370 [Aureobasidium pullulans]|uniref:SMP-LTD domain-containing protein n=1 Tax=Aureobasidium pullulans TaxID=5580 RepID=A0A4S9L0A3_AURPU|nr:hypothetical protein D6D01_06370 [Aureobasidium pullulans]